MSLSIRTGFIISAILAIMTNTKGDVIPNTPNNAVIPTKDNITNPLDTNINAVNANDVNETAIENNEKIQQTYETEVLKFLLDVVLSAAEVKYGHNNQGSIVSSGKCPKKQVWDGSNCIEEAVNDDYE